MIIRTVLLGLLASMVATTAIAQTSSPPVTKTCTLSLYAKDWGGNYDVLITGVKDGKSTGTIKQYTAQDGAPAVTFDCTNIDYFSIQAKTDKTGPSIAGISCGPGTGCTKGYQWIYWSQCINKVTPPLNFVVAGTSDSGDNQNINPYDPPSSCAQQ